MMKRTFFFLFVCLLNLSSVGQTHAALTIKDKDKAKAEIIFRLFAYKRDAVACKRVEEWTATSLIPLAQKYKILCNALKGDQTSQSLEEAKHGLFSYFLMRGLEGDADANNDNQITAGELHSYVTDKVERQSGFKQTPDIQGDAERVIARFE